MKKYIIYVSSLVLVGVFAVAASAQFTISIPKIPKVKKETPSTTPTPSASSDGNSGQSGDQQRQSVQNTPNDCANYGGAYYHYKDSFNELLKDVRAFGPDRDFTSAQNDEYLLAALSPRNRKVLAGKLGEWYPCLSGILDNIAAEAKAKLPQLTLDSSYSVRNPIDERIMRTGVSDLNNATEFKIGLEVPGWIITKNDLGIPETRFKRGAIWVKYPTNDTGFCQILWINVVQDYAGGGTWGSSHANFVRNQLAGCPAGK